MLSPPNVLGQGPERAYTKLRSQLSSLGERFSGFDDIVADESRQRRQHEEQKFRALNEELLRLQQQLNGEVSQQVESFRALRDHLQNMTNEMLRNLQKNVMKSLEHNMMELETLVSRCDNLEKSMAELRTEVPAKLQAEMIGVVRGIHHLREIIKQEQQWKFERDNAVNSGITELQDTVVAKINAEASLREEQRDLLSHKLAEFSNVEDTNEGQFRDFVAGELQILRKALELATDAREQSDDQILKALYQYTEVLEKGVALTTSVD